MAAISFVDFLDADTRAVLHATRAARQFPDAETLRRRYLRERDGRNWKRTKDNLLAGVIGQRSVIGGRSTGTGRREPQPVFR